MIRHIVMWRFKDSAEGKDKAENIKIATESLYALVGRIDEIKKMEIGADLLHTAASMDMALVTEFDSLDTLHTYAVHPEHLKVAEFMKKVTETRVVLDCEL
ncbi:MAG: Dabb family protein [Clostridia bacterium]|nr:Dabb family protein [Clostridia bacterium]